MFLARALPSHPARRPDRPLAVADGTASNGILFKSDVFERETAPVTLEINRVNLQPDTQRTLTYALFLHIASGRRIIFTVTHFAVNASSTANSLARIESAHIVGRTLSDLRAAESDHPAIILTSDFNQSSSIVDSPFAVLATYGLTSAGAKDLEVENPTLDCYNEFNPAMTSRQNGECVDAVLTTADLGISTAGVFVNFATGTALHLATPLPLDHNMIRVTVSIVKIPSVQIQGASGAVTAGGNALAFPSTSWASGGKVSACITSLAAPSGPAAPVYPADQGGALGRLG